MQLTISLLGYFLVFSKINNIKLGYIPFFILSLILILLYFGSIFGLLHYSTYFLLRIGQILFALEAFNFFNKSKKTAVNEINKKTLWICLISVPFALIYKSISTDFNFYSWDEFSWWGSSIKWVYENNSVFTEVMPLGYKNFPPGVQLLQYFFLKNTFWSEKNVLFIQDCFIFTTLLAVSNIFFKARSYLVLIAFISSTTFFYFFSYTYSSLYVDGLLGLFFASSLAFAISEESPKIKLIGFLCSVFIMILLKSSGIIFSMISCLIYINNFLINKKIFSSGLKISSKKIQIFYHTCLPLILILFVYISWSYYIRNFDVSLRVTIPNFNVFFKDYFIDRFSSTLISIIKNFSADFFVTRFFNISMLLFLILLIILIGLIALYERRYLGKKNSSFVSTNTLLLIGFLVYVLFLIFIYLFVFGNYEGTGAASFPRYVGSYFIGWSLLIFLYLIKKIEHKRNAVFFLILTIFLFVPKNYYKDLKEIRTPTEIQNSRIRITGLSDIVKENIKAREKVYFIAQNTNGFEKHIFAYSILPFEIEGWCWSFGKKYFSADLWTCDEDFRDAISGYSYLVIYNSDHIFYEKYNQYFTDLRINEKDSVFKIVREKNKINFIRI